MHCCWNVRCDLFIYFGEGWIFVRLASLLKQDPLLKRRCCGLFRALSFVFSSVSICINAILVFILTVIFGTAAWLLIRIVGN